VTLTLEIHRDNFKENRHAEYLNQRSLSSKVITDPPNGPVLFSWLAIVVVVCNAAGVGPAGRRACGRSARQRPCARESGGRYCTAGQYGYVPL